jgi:hypothetical protein
MEATFKVVYVKKDMLAKTNGPSMRVNVMHISRPANSIDEDSLPVGPAAAG